MRNHYRMTKGGKADLAWQEYKRLHSDANTEWFDWARKFGGENVYAGTQLQGVYLDNVPVGWTSPSGLPSGCYRPQRRKACMEAYREFAALKDKPTGHTMAKLLDVAPIFEGLTIYLPGVELAGDESILSLHKDSEVPEGVELLKMSEFWALKEKE